MKTTWMWDDCGVVIDRSLHYYYYYCFVDLIHFLVAVADVAAAVGDC